jgi:uncharacterized protein (DUF1697 family)
MKYVAFLRGINVGGNTKVEMGTLRQVFEKLGFSQVKTVLNSGNVVFEGEKITEEQIEQVLVKTFGFPIVVILRTAKQLQELLKKNPFKNMKVTPETRLQVTFLKDSVKPALTFPYQALDHDFEILGVFDQALCSVVTLTSRTGTVDLMDFLQKEYGKNSTTRTWGTVQKIVSIGQNEVRT